MKTVDYEKYLFYEDIEKHLLYLKDEYSDCMKLHILAKTEEGRKIYLAEISKDVNSQATSEKGGYYVQGAIHANECGGSSAAMHLIDILLYEKPDILNNVVFYIVPRVNPDNVEKNMLTNAEIRSKSVRDLRFRENVLIEKDMNGDGKILQMRRLNPLGNYKEVAPGIMLGRTPEDKEGPFYDVYTEGEFENFNDSKVNYSSRNYDFNRAFPCNWAPNRESSEYPLRHTEVRAVAEFLVTHPNIFAGLDFHNGSSGILRPPMKPDSQTNPDDLELINEVGEKATEITGLPLVHEYMYGTGGKGCIRNGMTNDFFYTNLGISHYVIELGNGLNDLGIRTDEFEKSKGNFYTYLKKIKEYEESNGNIVFYPFEPYNHPQLGEVEIGGSFRGTSYYMNPKNIAPLVEKTTEFALNHATMGPKLKISNCEVLELDENVFRIRAQIKNLGHFGTKIMKGTNSYQAQYPVHIYLEGSEEFEIYSRPNIYEIPSLDSMESCYVEWFIKSESAKNITIVAKHPKCKPFKVKLF